MELEEHGDGRRGREGEGEAAGQLSESLHVARGKRVEQVAADVREEHRNPGVEERQADEQGERELGAFTLLKEGLGQAPKELYLLADRWQPLAKLLLGGGAQARRYNRRA